MADNRSKLGNSYIRIDYEIYILRSQVVWPMSLVVCEKNDETENSFRNGRMGLRRT